MHCLNAGRCVTSSLDQKRGARIRHALIRTGVAHVEKINKVCGICGSDEITLNAAVKWDVTDQRYRLSMDGGEYDDVWCEACEDSTSIVDTPM